MVAPRQARDAGYKTLIFSDDFDDTSTIDMANSQVPGFHWYLAKWFVSGANAHNADQISVTDSVLTIGGGTGEWPSIVTAFDTGLDTYTGTVFGNGNYVEMRMKFDPSLNDTANPSVNGAPNFYGISVEHIADGASVSKGRWPGQVSGYAHFIEMDYMETLGGSTTEYQSNTHDWGGLYSGGHPQNITNGGNVIIGIGGADFTEFNTYGCLWVPQNGNIPGRVQRYFNDALVSTIYYLGPPGDPPLPTDGANSFTPDTVGEADRTYSIMDAHRLVILMGAGQDWPMHVDWIRVWGGTPTQHFRHKRV
jgi:hypothetical protein